MYTRASHSDAHPCTSFVLQVFDRFSLEPDHLEAFRYDVIHSILGTNEFDQYEPLRYVDPSATDLEREPSVERFTPGTSTKEFMLGAMSHWRV